VNVKEVIMYTFYTYDHLIGPQLARRHSPVEILITVIPRLTSDPANEFFG